MLETLFKIRFWLKENQTVSGGNVKHCVLRQQALFVLVSWFHMQLFRLGALSAVLSHCLITK